MLRSARVRREAYPGQWLPEPVVSAWRPSPDAYAPDPAERAVRTDQVGMALLVVLERLAPEQRVAFVLHDVFAVPFARVADVLGTTEVAARQLASRARRAVTSPDVPRHTADLAEQRRVLEAFVAATESGELDQLLQVLAPDVVFVGDSRRALPRGPAAGARRRAGGSLHARPVRPAGRYADRVRPDRARRRRARPADGDGAQRRAADPPGHRVRRRPGPDHRHLQPAQPGETDRPAAAGDDDGWPPRW